MRGNTQDKINEVMLDTYWNGGSPKEQSRYYDDFVVATERIGADTPPVASPVHDLRVSDATAATGTLDAALRWSAPANAITYTLRYSSALITDANWGGALAVSVPFTASSPGSAEQLDVTVPYAGGVIYFALKSQNAQGSFSPLSNNAWWPHRDIFLPLILRLTGLESRYRNTNGRYTNRSVGITRTESLRMAASLTMASSVTVYQI